MPQNVFNATFEQSKKAVKKTILKTDGDLYSMQFSKRLIGTIITCCFFGIMLLAIGIGMPLSFVDAPKEEIFIISYSTAQAIGRMGLALKPVFLVVYTLFFISGIINLFLGRNLKWRLIYSNIFMIFFSLIVMVSALPMVIGLSLDGTGVLGAAIQFLLGIILICHSLEEKSKEYKFILYVNDKKVNHLDSREKNKINFYQYGGILVLFSMAHRYFFHLGSDLSNSPGLFGVLYGWAIIIFLGAISLALSIGFASLLEIYYFIKYADEYYVYFKPTDETWYGKRKAKKIAKKKSAS